MPRHFGVPPTTLCLHGGSGLPSDTVCACPRRMDLYDDGERHDSLHRPGGIDATAVERLPRCGRQAPTGPLHRAPPGHRRGGWPGDQEPRRWPDGGVPVGFGRARLCSRHAAGRRVRRTLPGPGTRPAGGPGWRGGDAGGQRLLRRPGHRGRPSVCPVRGRSDPRHRAGAVDGGSSQSPPASPPRRSGAQGSPGPGGVDRDPLGATRGKRRDRRGAPYVAGGGGQIPVRRPGEGGGTAARGMGDRLDRRHTAGAGRR